MKKLLLFSMIICAGSSLVGCLGRQSAGKNKQEGADAIKKITIPDVPPMLTSPEDRAEFLALHYWDNFDFADTTYIDLPEVTEQSFADYLAITGMTPLPVVRRSISSLVDNTTADEKMYYYFSGLFEKYLDDPNSPMRNEEFYIIVLESIVDSDKVSELDKLRPQAQLVSANKNRVGTRAADILLTNGDGSKTRLYDIKADYTLLYFNNPDCNYCEEVTGLIRESDDMLMPLVRQGVLKVVAVYPDEDLTAWHNHYNDMPSEWHRTYDAEQAIRKDQTYDLRAIPSLYLLDANKNVIMKDVDKVWQVEQFFAMQGY